MAALRDLVEVSCEQKSRNVVHVYSTKFVLCDRPGVGSSEKTVVVD